PASIGESELLHKAIFKEYNIPIILKSITIPKQFSLKEFIREFTRYQNIKSHDNVLTIFGLTKQESEVIGTPREYSLIYKDCWCHDANKRPSIQYVVAHLNKIVIVEEFEEFEEYAMEEDEIQLDQVDKRITIYKIDDRHSLLQNLLQLFITLFNTTTNSMQIINNLFNYFEVNQIDPSFIFNQLAYQDYNFSMIGYFHEHGIGTD
ncbi:38120_t:CDS:2, partial [Gigaspora margarita]